MISVLIPTKDRSKDLKRCISSILKSTFKDFEVLVLDQSTDGKTLKCVRDFTSKKIKYIKLISANKSKALNKGIAIAKGEIISFTDDDCIVSTNWLGSIAFYFKDHPEVSGVFGKTLPYKPEKNKGLVCPAIFYKPTETITNDSHVIFCRELGQGNNVSFRKSLFEKVGKMNTLFGPGATIPTAEDCEFIYRALTKKISLSYTPKALVYHNKWISRDMNRSLQLGYTFGMCACAAYLYRKSRDRSLASLLKYKIEEHITSKFKHLRNARDVVYMLNQGITIVRGAFAGFLQK